MIRNPFIYRISATLILCLFTVSFALAQKKANFGKAPKVSSKSPKVAMYKNPSPDESDISWKSTRLEYMLGLGPSAFLGDLGGQDGVGKPFLYDLEPTQTRYSISAGARYFVREYHAIRGYATYARVRGNDALTNYPNRKYRNLNFKSPIIEMAAIYEWHLIKPKYIHFAGAKSTKVFDGNRFGAYLSAGAGLFYFNPKAEYEGQWHALQPLGTEGQGLPDGPDPYKRRALSFPIGGGAYILMNRNYTLGFDLSYRWTTSDYIDDASGYYYDNDVIERYNGKLAAYLANPSVALSDVPDPRWYTKDQPRGGQESNDTYVLFQVTLSKSFTPSITNKEFKPSKRKKGKSYNKKEKKRFWKGEKKGKTYKSKGIKNSKRKFKAPKLNFGKRRKKNKIRTF